ncbi:hypothetical protein [Williamsia deligens]|uniref:Mce-associated membrane protein n=1 Tax=Williamsia deligens TaxID=321325 RepID=A0ABW3G5G6_9NOCA|nr:hypothetical protein [Williamsia deligens]
MSAVGTSAGADDRLDRDGRRSRRRVRRPAGPPGADTTPSTPASGSTSPSAPSAPARPVRRSAPISGLRRTSTPTPAETAPAETAPDDAVSEAVDAAETSAEASPSRSGATLSYRERRRGATAVARRAPLRRSRLGLYLAGTVAVLLVAALAAVSVFFAVGTARVDDRAAQRAEYVAFARQMVVNLTSLSPATVDATLDEFRRDASGKALEDTQQTLQQTVDLIKSQNVTTKGTILADAVVSSDAEQATVLIVSGWTMNNPQPVVQTFRWKVTVSRIDGAMKLTGYEWVT